MGPGAALRHHRQGGQAMVEFALVVPILLLLLLGAVDLGRGIQANSQVADASRQAARMISANAATSDSPFSPFTGNCSGTTLTPAANGTGCLTNDSVLATVRSVLRGLLPGANVSLYGGIDAATCASQRQPAPGYVSVCVNPDERGTPGTPFSCPAVIPTPGALGTRYESWSAPTRFRGCYLVQVTVSYGYQPWSTAVLGPGASIVLSSTSTMLADY